MPPSEKAELDRLILGQAKPPTFNAWLWEVSPNWTWDWEYQLAIQAQLERVERHEIDRLMLFVPPRHGKSELLTVRHPAYVIEKHPAARVIVGAYSAALSFKFSRKTRKILRSRVPLSMERRAVDDWETQAGGGGRYVGVGGGVTGMGADRIYIDDPVKSREEANSTTYREKVWDWYKDDLYTRLEPGAAICLIMTRWHVDDLAGRLLAEMEKGEGDDWTVIRFPALAEQNDPLGREEGVALCPARYDETALARIRRVLGEAFLALYQQRPVAASGNMVKREWIPRYGTPPAEFLRIVQSWDTANKAGELNDYSVCTTWGETRLGTYLLHVYRDRLDFPALVSMAKSHAARWQPTAVLVEDKGSGTQLIQTLRNETSLPVIPILPERDKVTRMATEAPAYEARTVYHPESAPWLMEYEEELFNSPLSPHMDQVDSTSQYLRWAKGAYRTLTMASTGSGRAGLEADDQWRDDVDTGWGRLSGGSDLTGF